MKQHKIVGALALILCVCMVASTAAISSDDSAVDSPILASSVSSSLLNIGDTGTASISVSGATVSIVVSGTNSSWSYYWVISWGDSSSTSTSTNRTDRLTHTYSANGSYTVQISQEATLNGEEETDLGNKSFTANIDSISSEPTLNWQTPPALETISRSTFNYTPSTNISGATFTKVSGASWLSISNGKITGTAPTVSVETSYSAVFRATSPGGQTATQTISVDVFPVASLSATSRSISGTVNSAITSVTISSNLDGRFTVYSGSLPSGVSLNASTGVISGTPTTVGTYTATIRQTVSEGPSQYPTISVTYTITGASFTITSTPPSTIIVAGSTYTYTPTASISGVTWTISSAPSWLSVSNGTITGSVPSSITEAGNETYTLIGTKDGVTRTQSVTVSVEPVLEFTTIPTASMMVIPVYDYNEDGTPVLSAKDGEETPEETDKIEPKRTLTYQFVFTGSDAQSLLWDFGDGNTSTEWSPTHTYSESGTYTITLTATNPLGSDTCTYELVIPEADDVSEVSEKSLYELAKDHWWLIILAIIVLALLLWRIFND